MIHLLAQSLLDKGTIDKGSKVTTAPNLDWSNKQANQQQTAPCLYILTQLSSIALANTVNVMADIQ